MLTFSLEEQCTEVAKRCKSPLAEPFERVLRLQFARFVFTQSEVYAYAMGYLEASGAE